MPYGNLTVVDSFSQHPPISKRTVSTQRHGFTFTVGKRKRYFYMFLFSKDRYFFLSGFTAYFSVLLNLGSSPVQPLLSSDTVTNHKGFLHRPAHLFPSFSVFLHIKHTNTTAADSFALSFYRHGHLYRMIQLLLDLNEVHAAPFLPWAIYLMANAKKRPPKWKWHINPPLFFPFSSPPAFLQTPRSDKLPR